MVKGALSAQCKGCHRVLYDDKWLFGRMSIKLPHIAQVECPDCAAKGAAISQEALNV